MLYPQGRVGIKLLGSSWKKGIFQNPEQTGCNWMLGSRELVVWVCQQNTWFRKTNMCDYINITQCIFTLMTFLNNWNRIRKKGLSFFFSEEVYFVSIKIWNHLIKNHKLLKIAFSYHKLWDTLKLSMQSNVTCFLLLAKAEV